MKPLIYTISKSYGGEIAMDEEEFKKILNEVYDAGYEDGRIQATRAPLAPTPIPVPNKPYWDWTKKPPEIPCDNTNDTSKECFDNGQVQMFENFPTGNSLYLSKVFKCDREPTIFTCYDKNNQLYFCFRIQCLFPRLCIIVSIDKDVLDRGIADNIPLLDFYKGREVVVVEQEEPYRQVTYRTVRYEDIPRGNLPHDLERRLYD